MGAICKNLEAVRWFSDRFHGGGGLIYNKRWKLHLILTKHTIAEIAKTDQRRLGNLIFKVFFSGSELEGDRHNVP